MHADADMEKHTKNGLVVEAIAGLTPQVAFQISRHVEAECVRARPVNGGLTQATVLREIAPLRTVEEGEVVTVQGIHCQVMTENYQYSHEQHGLWNGMYPVYIVYR